MFRKSFLISGCLCCVMFLITSPSPAGAEGRQTGSEPETGERAEETETSVSAGGNETDGELRDSRQPGEAERKEHGGGAGEESDHWIRAGHILGTDIGEMPLSGERRALTEILEEATRTLALRQSENRQLRKKNETMESVIREKEKKIEELKLETETYEERLKEMEESLEQWRSDVLGFREEMRDYHEAQIEVLQTIMGIMQRSFAEEDNAN